MKVSLVISTYNWKEALGLCLLSVTQQTVIPTEVMGQRIFLVGNLSFKRIA